MLIFYHMKWYIFANRSLNATQIQVPYGNQLISHSYILESHRVKQIQESHKVKFKVEKLSINKNVCITIYTGIAPHPISPTCSAASGAIWLWNKGTANCIFLGLLGSMIMTRISQRLEELRRTSPRWCPGCVSSGTLHPATQGPL